MGYAFGALSGPGPHQVYVDCTYLGYDQGGNYSRYQGIVRYYGNGSGSWTNDTQYWSANFNGAVVSGTFTVPYANRGDSYRQLWVGEFWVGHSAEGWGPAFGVSAYIDTNHASIGDGGASFTEGAPPRIPKPPTQAQNVRVLNAKPTELTIAWDPPADNRGAGIIDYLARINVGSPADVAPWTDVIVNGSTLQATFSGLKPGTPYYLLVYPRNAAGYAPKSAELTARTLSGGYSWTGTEWRPVEGNVYTDAGWRTFDAHARTETTWKQAT